MIDGAGTPTLGPANGNRLGFRIMQLIGPGLWGPFSAHDGAVTEKFPDRPPRGDENRPR